MGQDDPVRRVLVLGVAVGVILSLTVGTPALAAGVDTTGARASVTRTTRSTATAATTSATTGSSTRTERRAAGSPDTT